MLFRPYNELGSTPNVIVDGAPNSNTVLTLSHWPKSGTPTELKRDTSAEIAFAYLDSPRLHLDVDSVSNNHFDEDGLVGILALVDPGTADRHRDLLIDVATAGDFGRYRRREAARIAFTISAFANVEESPLPREIFALPYMQMATRIYAELLPLTPKLLTNVGEYERFWREEDETLTASEELFDRGEARIEEQPELDLALVRIAAHLPEKVVHRFTGKRRATCHPMAIHNRTGCFRVLIIQGQHVEFQYRYESWVQFVSRRPLPRVDLNNLARELNQEETSGGKWVFDGVDAITPRLHLDGSATTSLDPDAIRKRLEEHLAAGAAAWEPYD